MGVGRRLRSILELLSEAPARPVDEHPLRVLASPSGQDPTTTDRVNPYITQLYESVRRHGVVVDEYSRRRLLDRYDVIHIHWPEFLVDWSHPVRAVAHGVKVLGLLWLARARGARVVWTGHDLAPHDSVDRRLYRPFIATLIRMVDAVISPGAAGLEALRARYPGIRGTPSFVIPLGSYRDEYGPAPDRVDARRSLGLPAEATLLLLFGQIRPYKEVPALLEAFAGLPDDGDAHLAVVGEVRSSDVLEAEIVRAAAGRARVHLRLEYVPASEVAAWHAAADVVVLPYSEVSALHSSAVLLALSYGRPVITADTATMRELADRVGPDWVLPTSGGPSAVLRRAFEVAAAGPAASPDLRGLDWSTIGADTVAAYRSIR